uniref:Uncharacterized protein LOC105851660 n=1 Tax=Cicer arietinum TaxID=3827 RepID=A0A3Q7XQW7_CICAR|nr:uncharacterized protein LOC105851660 [Cicer arietinum]
MNQSMDTRKGNKLPSKLVSDSISMDSLSFSGLVSIQDQQPKFPSPPNHAKHYQAFAFQTTPSLIPNPPGSSRPLLANHINSEMSSRKTGSTMKYHELGKASKHTNKQSTTARTGFGQKMKSFLSPCKECRTIKPDAVKAQTVQRESFKLY